MLQLQIITPEKIVFEDTVDEVIAPTTEGQISILANHIGLMTQIEPGELTTKKGGTIHHIAITGGFLEVKNNTVSILADYAVRSEHIEAAKALEAQKRAEQKMKEAKEKSSDRDFALAEAEFRRAILELKVVTKRKPRLQNS